MLRFLPNLPLEDSQPRCGIAFSVNVSSYSSTSLGPFLRLREAWSLYKINTDNIAATVAEVIRRLRALESLLQEEFGVHLENKDILEVGAGQLLLQMRYFNSRNRVVGIDSDVIAEGFSLLTYAKMLKYNGYVRTAKTLVRKGCGIDRRYRLEFNKQLSINSSARLSVMQMDVQDMNFQDEAFDFVHCLSVFHHLPDPAKAIREIVRCLRRGGIAFISFHLYSSESGSLDPRVFTARSQEVRGWLHLRPSCQNLVHANAFLNRLRLAEWKSLFKQFMPGCILTVHENRRVGVDLDAMKLIESGELANFTMEELVAHNVTVLWQKSQQRHSGCPELPQGVVAS